MRVRGWFWPAVTAGMVGNALRLRRRVAALKVIEPADDPPLPTHLIVTAAGVHVDHATACAASRHAVRHGLEALDLVPADLPVERLIDLAWLTHPGRFRGDPLARGRGALTALLLTEDLASRLGIDAVDGYSQTEMLRLCARAKRYAPLASDLAVAPGLHAAAHHDPAARMPCLEASFSVAAPMVVGIHAACLAALAKGAASRRPAALAALAAHALVPLVATRGTAVTPRDMPVRVPGRLLAASGGLVHSAFARRRRPDIAAADALAARRADYDRRLSGGLDAFFSARRPDCPMCGSDHLDLLLALPELNQGKPGTFRLDECGACGHVFQNPRLTPAGLDFYYGDFYDGMGAEHTELVFGAGRPSYRGRAALVESALAPDGEPRRWLDVGAGQGHFCLVARSIWPKVTFDGLDIGAGVDEAARRGWVDHAWRGLFPELVASAPSGLAGSYDVVSMHHYLEHTDDPGVELDAARTVLEPGGLLLIELPDASSWLGRRLGRYWAPWLQPQHLHFLSVARLEAMLAERGFTVLDCQRSEPHQPAELLLALYLLANRIAPPVDVPWRPPSSRRARLWRTLVLGLAAPLFVVAVTLDGLLAPVLSRTGASNSFRILARADQP